MDQTLFGRARADQTNFGNAGWTPTDGISTWGLPIFVTIEVAKISAYVRAANHDGLRAARLPDDFVAGGEGYQMAEASGATLTLSWTNSVIDSSSAVISAMVLLTPQV